MEAESWLNRPALEWNPEDAKANYWDVVSKASIFQCGLSEFVESYQCTPHCSSDEQRVTCYLSYLSVSIVAASLAHNLRRILRDQVDDGTATSYALNPAPVNDHLLPYVPSLAVAIAVPEGLLLPLSMLAVHALNWPFTCSQSLSISVAILPLDPSDAPKRNERMIQLCKPFLILTASKSDAELMKQLSGKDNVLDLQTLLSIESAHTAASAKQTILDLASKEGTNCWEHCDLRDWIIHCEQCLFDLKETSMDLSPAANRISHVVFTSGSTGLPKGCVSSVQSLLHYLRVKNLSHGITSHSKVLLASSVSFDPCLGDILATLTSRATLAITRRCQMLDNLLQVLQFFCVSHCLCTPTLWSTLSLLPNAGPKDLPHLQVIALGGETIPLIMLNTWARERGEEFSDDNLLPPDGNRSTTRLLATYGVTEACIYQTVGELFCRESKQESFDVGLPFEGLAIRICNENSQESLEDASPNEEGRCKGEVVIHGRQVDEWSTYLHQPQLSSKKFVLDEMGRFCYRTAPVDDVCFGSVSFFASPHGAVHAYLKTYSGDRGYIDPSSSRLNLCGRIEGGDEMLKVGGVRVETGEIEAAIVDEDTENPVVVECIVAVSRNSEGENETPENDLIETGDLIGYLVLSQVCLKQMGVNVQIPVSGALCSDGPLEILIRERCRTKAKVTPGSFAILPRIPQSPTGKRSRVGVPSIRESIPFVLLVEGNIGSHTVPLQRYSETGALLMSILTRQLNLIPAQQALITSSSSFAVVGGDSLAATRVVRALFAYHHGVQDSRFLGGEYGTLRSPFTAQELLSAKSLGSYVDWLDERGFRDVIDLRTPSDNQTLQLETDSLISSTSTSSALYCALFQSTTLGWTNVAIGLLEAGADPNFGAHSGRLGKVSGRKNRMATFRSSPLHVACQRGDSALVRALLTHKARFNSPDPLGLFPIHLVAAGEAPRRRSERSTCMDDEERLECMKSLLDAGAPLTMKDGSHQTVLHCAARSGRCGLLRFLMGEWQRSVATEPRRADSVNWRDNWARTPVHWAVLNGHVEALEILVEMGCNAHPRKPTSIAHSSVANESPAEICHRLYGSSELGKRIMFVLGGDRNTL